MVRKQEPEPLEPLLEPEELARLMKVKRKHLYNLMRRGKAPPAIRIGRMVRFDARDYRLWLEGRKG